MTPRTDDDTLRAILAHAEQVDPRAVPPELADALLAARSRPALAADWRMAEAALGHPDALALWQEALDHLPAPARDAERAQVHERLAALRLAAGDRERGCRHLAAALDATPPDDAPARLRRSRTLGAHLLAAGLRTPALEALHAALELAMALDETLWVLGLASTLAAQALEDEAWDAAADLGQLVAETAARRGNWLGIADGTITRSACCFYQDDLRGALEITLRAAARLQQHGALAAVNLLRAHLVELRAAVADDDLFDALFEAVRADLEAEQPPAPASAPLDSPLLQEDLEQVLEGEPDDEDEAEGEAG